MGSYEQIEKKIVSWNSLRDALRERRESTPGCRVVFTNGCFDLVHRGHLDYLSRSRDLGDLLVVGINSDASVRRLKGCERPIMDQDSRALLLAAFQFVDYVTLFVEDTPYELINLVQPDVLVKGGDYNPDTIVGADIVRSKGGKVEVLHFVDGFSTTQIINKLKNTN